MKHAACIVLMVSSLKMNLYAQSIETTNEIRLTDEQIISGASLDGLLPLDELKELKPAASKMTPEIGRAHV